METLFFIFAMVIGLGLLSYWLVSILLKPYENSDEELDSETLGEMKLLVDSVRQSNYGTKFMVIFVLGGTLLSEFVVGIINFPFEWKKRKS